MGGGNLVFGSSNTVVSSYSGGGSLPLPPPSMLPPKLKPIQVCPAPQPNPTLKLNQKVSFKRDADYSYSNKKYSSQSKWRNGKIINKVSSKHAKIPFSKYKNGVSRCPIHSPQKKILYKQNKNNKIKPNQCSNTVKGTLIPNKLGIKAYKVDKYPPQFALIKNLKKFKAKRNRKAHRKSKHHGKGGQRCKKSHSRREGENGDDSRHDDLYKQIQVFWKGRGNKTHHKKTTSHPPKSCWPIRRLPPKEKRQCQKVKKSNRPWKRSCKRSE